MKDNGSELVLGLSVSLLGPVGRVLQLSIHVTEESVDSKVGLGVGEDEGLAGPWSVTV